MRSAGPTAVMRSPLMRITWSLQHRARFGIEQAAGADGDALCGRRLHVQAGGVERSGFRASALGMKTTAKRRRGARRMLMVSRASIYRRLGGQFVRDERQPVMVGGGEFLQAVRAPVHQAARFAQIAGCECRADSFFARLQKAGQQSRRDFGLAGEIRIFDQLLAQPDRRAVVRIIRTAGKLDEAPALEARAVGCAADCRDRRVSRRDRTDGRRATY